ncbi:MAG TPA: 4Fe-4S binding protein [Thermoleophilia bacterium]|nr:4Fe-4S binding protein [Thermoleophilia bacterium]
MTSSPDALVAAAGLPDFLLPWVDRFYEPLELDLAEVLAAGPLTELEVLRRIPGITTVDLARAARRGVVDPDGDGERVALADFHARFEIWAMFEGWRDVPDDVAARLNRWELVHYEDGLAADLAIGPDGAITADPGSSRDAAYSYILLDEAEATVCRVPHVYQWPCDCRAMFGRCRKPVNVCLRFDNDRGLGWEISAERAVALLREADHAGLMHTAVVGAEGEAGAICNCCTDCCFPHQASRRLGIDGQWPRRRYLAVVDPDACTLCGRCVKRCPFEALSLPTATEPGQKPKPGREREPERAGTPRDLLFTADRCRGCGLCATGCRESAIAMAPRP